MPGPIEPHEDLDGDDLAWLDEPAEPFEPLEGSWIRSRPVRVTVVVLVAIAMAAVMLGWAFLGMDRGDDAPEERIEVSEMVGRL